MSTINSGRVENSSQAAVSILSQRWLIVGGAAAVASLVAALAISLTARNNPDVTSAAALFARLLITAIFFISGIQKIVWPSWALDYISSVGLPFAPIGLVIGIGMELVGGSALALGYETRVVAALFVGYCVASAAFFHRDFHDENQLMNFFKNIAMAGGLLQIIAFGPGNFSLDAAWTG